MPSGRHTQLFFYAGWLLAGTAIAQENRIDQARQVDLLRSTLVTPSDAVAPITALGTASADGDSFGVQQILKEQERLRYFRAYADISAYSTSNVALSRTDAASDSFLLATFAMEYRRPLPRGFTIDAGFRYATYRYHEYGVLDFSSIDAGLGLSYRAEKLWSTDLFLRYNYNELISRESRDTFFTNHTVTLGAQKVVPFSRAHYAYLGVAGQVGFADPEVSERSDLSTFAGYHLQITRNLETDLVYRLAYLPYTEGGRRDLNQTLSFGLRYRFTEWLSASANAYATWNRSNRAVFDYDAVNGGGGLTLSIQF